MVDNNNNRFLGVKLLVIYRINNRNGTSRYRWSMGIKFSSIVVSEGSQGMVWVYGTRLNSICSKRGWTFSSARQQLDK